MTDSATTTQIHPKLNKDSGGTMMLDAVQNRETQYGNEEKNQLLEMVRRRHNGVET